MKKNKIKKQIQKYLTWHPPKLLVISLLLLITTFYSFTSFKLDNDFWFIINTGKYILNNGFPTIEPFTMHTNLTYLSQQWLTAIIFYQIYSKLGIYGRYIFMLIINIIITYLIYQVSNLINENKEKLSIIITILSITLIKQPFIVTRPQIFDIILILIEIYLLELYIKKHTPKYLLGLPLISLLMINLHSSMWLMLFIILLPYYLGRINLKHTTKESYNLKPLIITTLVMIPIGLINPYGISSITYIFKSYGIDYINNLVLEMMPLTLHNNIITLLYIFFILITYYINKKRIINIRYLLLFLGTLYLSLSHCRGVLFLVITSILSINYNLKEYTKETKEEHSTKLTKTVIPVTLIIILTTTLVISTINKTNIEYEKDITINHVANYLDQNITKDINIYTGYNEGSYLEYRGYKCYLDPRAEVFVKSLNQKEDILLEYYNLQKRHLNYQKFLDKYNFQYLLLNKNNDVLSIYLENDPNYQKIYEEEHLVLYKEVSNEKDN